MSLLVQASTGQAAHKSDAEHGDSKKARDRLRKQSDITTVRLLKPRNQLADEKQHYASMFRSGAYIGLAMPAAIFALVLGECRQVHLCCLFTLRHLARQNETQLAIPASEALLQVYGALFLPVIFAMLFELNLDAFVSARINYEVSPTLEIYPGR